MSSGHVARTASESPERRTAVGVARRAAFFVAIGVLAARPLMSESFETLEVSFLERTERGPTPASTAWMDALLLAVAAVAALRLPPRSRLRDAVVAGLLLILAAVVVSSAAADNRRLAVNAGASFFIAALSGATLPLLMRPRWAAALGLAAMLATGVTTAWKCVAWRWYEYHDTLQAWETRKRELAEQGVDLRSPLIENFTRRLGAGEAMGYLSHPNNAASLLMMWTLPAVGLLLGAAVGLSGAERAGGGAARRGSGAARLAACAALCAALAAGLWLTHSLGGFVGMAAGLVLTFVLAAGAPAIARRPGRTVALLAAGYLAVIVAGAAWGLLRGTLPHASLAFRWHYWTAAARALADAPLTGLGRENFLAAYLAFKPPENPEEVRNAHNLWVTLAVELGPLGLAGSVVLLVAWAWAAVRAVGRCGGPAGAGVRRAPAGEDGSPPVAARALTVLATLAAHAAFARFGLDDPNLLIIWSIEIGTVWTVSFLGALWLLADCDGRALRWLSAATAAAVMAVLVENLVGFSLFIPAGAGVAVVLAAVATRLAPDPASGAGRAGGAEGARPWAALATVTVLIVHLACVALPTTRSETATDEAAAVAADAWDPAPAARASLAALQRAAAPGRTLAERRTWAEQALSFAGVARDRAARTAAHWRQLARAHEALWELRGPDAGAAGGPDHLAQAAECWEQAVRLHPTHSRTRIAAAECLARLWRERGDEAARRRAVAELSASLELDGRLAPQEVARLSASERATVRSLLEGLTHGDAPASAPATP